MIQTMNPSIKTYGFRINNDMISEEGLYNGLYLMTHERSKDVD